VVPPASQFLYATSSAGQVLSFTVDNKTGALGTPASVPGPTLGAGIASAQNRFLYVSDPQNFSIYAFSLDQTTGALTAVPGSPFSVGSLSNFFDPMWLVSGSSLYATGGNWVGGFTIAANGALTSVPGSPVVTGIGTAQAAFGQTNTNPPNYFLYVTDILDPNGTISTLQVTQPTGTLILLPGTSTQSFSAPDGIVFDGVLGPFVFVALNAANKIAAFSVDQAGALTAVPGSPFDTGSEPTFLALNPGQNVLYAVNRIDATISAYGIAPGGALTPVPGSPFPAGTTPEGIVVASDFLYVADTTSNSILGYSISPATGALTPVAGSPFTASGATLLTVVQIPAP
jgi:6-phosphogluconolactonase (cycloisomerase 2 family)